MSGLTLIVVLAEPWVPDWVVPGLIQLSKTFLHLNGESLEIATQSLGENWSPLAAHWSKKEYKIQI